MSAEIQSDTWIEMSSSSHNSAATIARTSVADGGNNYNRPATADSIADHCRSWVDRELEGMAPFPNMLRSVVNLAENVDAAPRTMKQAAGVAYSFMQDLIVAIKKFTNPWVQLEMLAGYLKMSGLDAVRVDNRTFAVRHQLGQGGDAVTRAESAFTGELLALAFAGLGMGARVDSNRERTLAELGPLPRDRDRRQQKQHRVALA
jgi:hypothetical protein